MVVDPFKKRDYFTLAEGVNEAKHFDAKSFHDHMVARVILEKGVEVFWLFENLKYLLVVQVLIVPEPLNSQDFK